MSTGKNGERFVWLVVALTRSQFRGDEGAVIGVFESSKSAKALCYSKRANALYSDYTIIRKTVKP